MLQNKNLLRVASWPREITECVSESCQSGYEVAECLLCCVRWSMKVSKFIVPSR